MLTAMTEDDWAIVLQVFRAVRSRRGDKGRDDRKFLEALHYFTVHNITWRALSAEFGHWNSIWKRFWRLSRAGIFEAFFDALAALSESAHLVQMFDSTVARAHVSAAGAKGGQDDQALGRSRGGFSTKIHLKVDLDGLPLAFHLTGGEASDSRNFELLLDIGPDILPRAAITDKGYDAKSNRDGARKRGICPVIPHRATATDRPAFFPKILYKARARIEQAVGKLKRFKRIALRCEKTARNYGSFVALALGIILIKSVHTAYAFLILSHRRRRLLWTAVTRNPTAEWLARQITEAFPWDSAPKYLIRDNDRAFAGVFKARVRAMGIRDRPTSVRAPWQNGYVERLIGSVRRECTDHLIVFSEEHLRQILAKYSTY